MSLPEMGFRCMSLREMGYQFRCTSHYGSGHVCDQPSGHYTRHVCQCGISWDRADNNYSVKLDRDSDS